MRKNARYLFLLLLITAMPFISFGQIATSVHQNFDVDCVLDTNFPFRWLHYNPLAETIPKGVWSCNPEKGRPTDANVATPGMQCTGYYDGDFHTDTAYLILPSMNLNTYTGSRIYLQFDTRTSAVADMSNLSVFVSYDEFFTSTDTDIDSDLISPKLTNPKDTLWSTHQIDLTGYENSSNFFLGFRYISTTGHGSIWYLDNMSTTPFRTGIDELSTESLKLLIKGAASRDEIKVSCSARSPGKYNLVVYDIMGREVRKEMMNVPAGSSDYIISGLNLTSGMYFVKMSDGKNYQAVKAIVQ